MSSNKYNNLIDNYLYLYHLDEWLLIPEYPESIPDKLGSTFTQTSALARTAPVFTYSNSGPRTVQVQLHLHRDILDDVNTNVSNLKLDIDEDYVDALIRKLQSIALPRYDTSNKSITPPMVALKIGNEIFIKGVVNGGISIDYGMPILENNKYALVTLNFEIYETEPYDAESVAELGSFRGITSQFKNGIYKGE